jgi:hypothetical protein
MRKAFLTIAAVGLLVQARLASPQTRPPTTLTGTRIAFGQDVRIERDEEVTDAVVVVGGSLESMAACATASWSSAATCICHRLPTSAATWSWSAAR